MSDHELTLLTLPSGPSADADGLLGAWNGARAAAGLEPVSPASWSWRTTANPDGARLGIARNRDGDADGRPSALVLGVRRAVACRGETIHWLEVIDVTNDFDAGSGLSRAGAVLALGRAYAEEFGGHAPERHPVMYGVPNRRVHRLGRKHLDFEILRSEYELRVRPDGLQLGEAPGVEVEELDRFPDGVSNVHLLCAEEREAQLVRDAERLEWRYTSHPERSYRIAVVRRAGEIRGFAVYRLAKRSGAAVGLLADWLVAPGDAAANTALLEWAGSRARSDEVSALVMGGSDNRPEWGAFQTAGFRVHGTTDYLAFRSFQRPYIMSWLWKNWMYSLGDTERG